ncbi:MAG TPA: TRAP transporter large permease subunit [Candidatus Limnocylindrales bacterium]|nr:TRAP transporter large permease subunit [Candidatus Limnocylindrales bacterium]
MKRLLEWFAGLILATEFVVVFLGVFFRYVLNNPLTWSEEIARLLLVWLTFMGGAVAFFHKQHIGVAIVYRRFSHKAQQTLDIVGQFILIFFFAFLFRWSVELVQRRWDEPSPAVGFSQSFFMLPLSIGVLAMIISLLFQLFRLPAREILRGGGIILLLGLGVGGLGYGLKGFILSLNPLLVLLTGFIILLVINTPIAFSLGLSALSYLVLDGKVPLTIMPQRMVVGVDSFVLLAVPLFIVAGALMETGGISQRLVNFAISLVGHIRGGLAMVVVISEILFSGISGSTTADVAAVGSLLIPAMIRAGYTQAEAASIVSASAAMGILVPPCIHMVVLGTLVNVSVAALFLGGFIPAFVLAASLMGLIYFKARRGKWASTPRTSWKQLGKTFLHAIIPLMTPVIIFGGIFTGIVTVTEAAVIAVAYALIVGLLIYREIKFRDLPRIFIESATTSGMALWLVTTATIFSWVMVRQQVPQLIVGWITSISSGSWFFLAFTVVLYLIFSGLLEGLPSLLILAPILYPVALQFHIDPIHFGIISIAALGIGFFMPPIGLGLFLSCSIAKANIGETAKTFAPYMLVLILTLLGIAFLEPLSLFIPRWFGFN